MSVCTMTGYIMFGREETDVICLTGCNVTEMHKRNVYMKGNYR